MAGHTRCWDDEGGSQDHHTRQSGSWGSCRLAARRARRCCMSRRAPMSRRSATRRTPAVRGGLADARHLQRPGPTTEWSARTTKDGRQPGTPLRGSAPPPLRCGCAPSLSLRPPAPATEPSSTTRGPCDPRRNVRRTLRNSRPAAHPRRSRPAAQLTPSGRSPTTGQLQHAGCNHRDNTPPPPPAVPLADPWRDARPGHRARGSRRSWQGSPQRSTKSRPRNRVGADRQPAGNRPLGHPPRPAHPGQCPAPAASHGTSRPAAASPRRAAEGAQRASWSG